MEKRRELIKKKAYPRSKRVSLGLIAALLILGIVFAICVSAGAIGYRINCDIAKDFSKIVYDSQLVPSLDTDGAYYFTTDREFKVLQITDTHIGGGFMTMQKDRWAINAVGTMISVEKPDLVILTGDVIYPIGIQTGSLHNLNQLKLVIDLFESLGVYWTFVFGNHDTEAPCTHTSQDICDYIKESKPTYCLFQQGPSNIDGKGNHYIKVKNSLGLITHSYIMLDSHSYREEGGYDNVKQNQIDWYSQVVNDIKQANLACLDSIIPEDLAHPLSVYQNPNSLIFMHIPLREYEIAWNRYTNEGNSEDIEYIYGAMRGPLKPVNCGAGEDELFETVLSIGSTTGIFVGHDHLNNFQISYKGIKLTYGMSIDYTAFTGIHRQGSQRGCTIIRCLDDASWVSENSNYYQDKYNSPGRNETVHFN